MDLLFKIFVYIEWNYAGNGYGRYTFNIVIFFQVQLRIEIQIGKQLPTPGSDLSEKSPGLRPKWRRRQKPLFLPFTEGYYRKSRHYTGTIPALQQPRSAIRQPPGLFQGP